MTRREEIQQAILENGIDYCEEHPEMNMNLKEAFVIGAVWADKTMIEKACDWLYEELNSGDNYYDWNEFLDDFRKAMEE